jgi:hypothetical protein
MSQAASEEHEFSDDVLLKSELEYITQTAFQANEDRARVSSFYLVAVGSLVAALLGTQFVAQNTDAGLMAWGFAILFLLLTVLGTLTTLQLARLRGAWYDSMLAMNQLKDYWLTRSTDKQLRLAFRWDTSTLPHRYKVSSISYYQALEVGALSGFTFGASVYFVQQAIGLGHPTDSLAWAVVSGILALALQMQLYKHNLGGEHAA